MSDEVEDNEGEAVLAGAVGAADADDTMVVVMAAAHGTTVTNRGSVGSRNVLRTRQT